MTQGGTQSTRRSFLRVGGAAAAVGLSGCQFFGETSTPTPTPDSTTTQSAGHEQVTKRMWNVPVTAEVRYPQPIVRGVPSPVVVEFVPEDGSRLHDPHARIFVRNARVKEPLAGHFPQDVEDVESDDAEWTSGGGIVDPLTGSTRASFGAIVVADDDADEVPVSIQLSHRMAADDELNRGNVGISMQAESRPSGEMGRDHLVEAARQRSRVADHFVQLLNRKSFEDTAVAQFREAVDTICIGSLRMLADAQFSQIVGLSKPADYLWESYTLHFKSPFEHIVSGESKPVDNSTPASEFGPPYFSEVLADAENLFDSFRRMVSQDFYQKKEVEGEAHILLASLSDAADDERRAWERGDDSRARQLLANQLRMLDLEKYSSHPVATDIADIDAIEQRFNSNKNVTKYSDYEWFEGTSWVRESTNLVVKLKTVKGTADDSPEYQTIVNGLRTAEEFFRGETNRIAHILKFVDGGGLDQTTSTPGSQKPPQPTDNLQGYWPFESVDSERVPDQSGNGHTGEVYGDPQHVSGPVGQALSFDGNEDFVLVEMTSELQTSGSFTLELWLKTTSSTTGSTPLGLYTYNGGGQGEGVWINANAETVGFTARHSSGYGQPGGGAQNDPYYHIPGDSLEIESGRWHHIALKYDRQASTIAMYRDGERRFSLSAPKDPRVDDTYLTIGARPVEDGPADDHFAGAVDEVVVYTKAIADAVIRRHSNRG